MDSIWKGPSKDMLKKLGEQADRNLNQKEPKFDCKKDAAFCDIDLGIPKEKDGKNFKW